MKYKMFLMGIITVVLCTVIHANAEQIQYSTEIEGNNITISGTAESRAKLRLTVPDLYREETDADVNGDFSFKFKLPIENAEYQYSLESLNYSSYFKNESDDFSAENQYLSNTAKRDFDVGNEAPSMKLEKNTRLVLNPHEAVDGIWTVSADFMIPKGNTQIMRITNTCGDTREINSEVNHLESSIAQEAIKIIEKNGKLYLYCVDNNTNQTERMCIPFADYTYGTWHRIAVMLNIPEGTVQIYLDDQRMLENQTLYAALQQNYGRLFDTAVADDTWYLDNVSIMENTIEGTLTCEETEQVFYELQRSTKSEFKEKLDLYRDYLNLENISDQFWDEQNTDKLYEKMKRIHRWSDLKKEVAVCDILSDTDHIEKSIEKYSELFISFGMYKAAAEHPEDFGNISIYENDTFSDIIRKINTAYNQQRSAAIGITNYVVTQNSVSFTMQTETNADVRIRLLDGDYEVVNKPIALTGGNPATFRTSLPKNGVDKKYLLVVESDGLAGGVYEIETVGDSAAYNMFYQDSTDGNILYPFENSLEVFEIKRDESFGHGAPSRFIDTDKRFIVNPAGSHTSGYYVAAADIYINSCNKNKETNLITIYDVTGKNLGAKLFLKNNCLKLQCENSIGTQSEYGIMLMTMKQWYNIALEVTPDLSLKIYIDGKAVLSDTDLFLYSNCSNALRMINIDTRNSELSLYIDNIMLYEDFLKERLDFEENKITEDQVNLPQQVNGEKIYWTSSKPQVITSEGKVYREREDISVKLTAISENGQARIYFVTVMGRESTATFDLKDSIDFNKNQLPVYTKENQKIEWTVSERGDELIYKAFVKDINQQCEFHEKISEVSNPHLTNHENRIVFSADYHTEKSYSVYMAFCDNSGKLLGIAKGNQGDMPQGTEVLKVFVWENGNQQPLTKNVQVYHFEPKKIYVILGSGKAEQRTDNTKSNVCICGVNDDVWVCADDMLMAFGEQADENVGFIDARDFSDMKAVAQKIQQTNADFKGAIYLNQYGKDSPASAIEICEQVDALQQYAGEFMTVAPTQAPVFSNYNQILAAASSMRKDFKVIDTGDLSLKNEFEYTVSSCREIGKRMEEKFN